MRVAISNIGWRREVDDAVAELLGEMGVGGIEVAPTVVWERPLRVSEAEARAYREVWEARGIRIVALQSLLYGRPDLTVFGAESKREETLEYLRGIFRLARWLGAGPLVFGSPANRRAGELPEEEQWRQAVQFFAAAGEAAAAEGVMLCLEANPREYDCDFVNTVAEARALVAAVAAPGFGLHLDAAAMTLAGDAAGEVAGEPAVQHFHISEPYLGSIGAGGVDHVAFAAALARAGYTGWCSIEMRAPAARRHGDSAPERSRPEAARPESRAPAQSPFEALRRATAFAQEKYGAVTAVTSRKS